MSTRIIVDSTVDMAERYAKKAIVVPLSLHFGEETFIDGVTIDRKRFYERLVESDILPTTSQPSPAAFGDVFDEVTAAGDSAVVLTVSSKLSGTFQSANIAAEKYDNIFVVDTRSASIGSGILAEYAIDCAERGMPAKELAACLEQKRNDVAVIALLNTLEYLKKGGRISKTVAFAGSLLGIHPVITMENGEVALVGKARGSKQGNNLLVQKIEQSGGVDFSNPILLGYTGLDDTLLKKYVEDSKHIWEDGIGALDSVCVCSVIGTYGGPGAVIAAFFKKDSNA